METLPLLTKTEIIRQAKHYFGKDKSHIKQLVLSYEFKSKHDNQWKNDIDSIISNPYELRYKLFEDVINDIMQNKANNIDWNWIGDLSWTLNIVLNSEIDQYYIWDKKLALKCNGTARVLTVYISEVVPCYTYDSYYMTYNKSENYYEFGPLNKLTNAEQKTILNITNLFKRKGYQFLEQEFCKKKFKNLYSDIHSDGNASLFDVLFSDTCFYTIEIEKFSDKILIEKCGTEFSWKEKYDTKGNLKERIENRWTTGGDYFKLVLDNKGQILQIEVSRKEIEKKKHQEFKLDIVETFKKSKLQADRKKKRS